MASWLMRRRRSGEGTGQSRSMTPELRGPLLLFGGFLVGGIAGTALFSQLGLTACIPLAIVPTLVATGGGANAPVPSRRSGRAGRGATEQRQQRLAAFGRAAQVALHRLVERPGLEPEIGVDVEQGRADTPEDRLAAFLQR